MKNQESNSESKLTSKELKYWKMMKPKSGVLFLQSAPGLAKTAVIETIANKLGFQYLDLRLSQMDETDIGLFPKLDGDTVSHAVPEWAKLANEKPTIIVFEELNRARESVRNAGLQILLERRIGYKFKFNSEVYMCATGNLGAADGCSIEEFDSALWNRLLPIEHTLNIKEWEEGFAKENVYEPILGFIKTHPDHFHKSPSENFKQYATPRSWTFLSDRIKAEASSILEAIEICIEDGLSYIGASNIPFIRYLEDQSLLNIKNVIEDFDKYQDQIKNLNRSKKSELMQELKSIKASDLKYQKQVNNIIKLLNLVHEDERMAYLLHLIDNEIDDSSLNVNKNVKAILNNFKDDMKCISDETKKGS
jgi:hypothetical protein